MWYAAGSRARASVTHCPERRSDCRAPSGLVTPPSNILAPIYGDTAQQVNTGSQTIVSYPLV